MSQVPGGPPAGGYPPPGGNQPAGGYPAQPAPGAYPPAGGAPPPQNWQPVAAGGPPPGGGKSSKNKTIAIVAGSVLGLALIGIGVKVLTGKDAQDVTTATGISGDGNLQPVPIASGTAIGVPTQPPSPPPSSPPPPVDGPQVDLGGVVTFAVPPPWEVMFDEENAAALGDGRDNFAYVEVGTTDPSTDAGSFLAQAMEGLLPPDLYSQVKTGEVSAVEPTGSVVSAAIVEYEATWTDSQNSFPLHGAAFAAIRQDGAVMVGTIESVPPEAFGTRQDQWGPMLEAMVNAFSGLV